MCVYSIIASIALKGVYSLIKVRPLSSISHDESKALAEKVAGKNGTQCKFSLIINYC